MASGRKIYRVAAVLISFVIIAVGIVCLGVYEVVTPAMMRLMLVALLGIYIGFAILYGVYRLVDKLD